MACSCKLKASSSAEIPSKESGNRMDVLNKVCKRERKKSGLFAVFSLQFDYSISFQSLCSLEDRELEDSRDHMSQSSLSYYTLSSISWRIWV